MAINEDGYCGFETAMSDPGILTITFNRPESMNASTAPMKRDLIEVLTQAQMEDSVRVVVFTGQGQAFWAGDNLKGYENDGDAHMPAIHGGQSHLKENTSGCLQQLPNFENMFDRAPELVFLGPVGECSGRPLIAKDGLFIAAHDIIVTWNGCFKNGYPAFSGPLKTVTPVDVIASPVLRGYSPFLIHPRYRYISDLRWMFSS